MLNDHSLSNSSSIPIDVEAAVAHQQQYITSHAISTITASEGSEMLPVVLPKAVVHDGMHLQLHSDPELAHMYWSNINYEVEVGNGEVKTMRKLLNNVSGRAIGGRMLAVMGPSGAGKTTLLNAICGRLKVAGTAKFSGSVLLNETPFTAKFKKIVAFVTQDDVVFEYDTPREALEFSHRIRTNATAAESKTRVNEVLEKLGLTKCADTVIGTPGLVRGISGGERKRVNIGAEYVVDPKYMLLDEPTTGLDSVTSVRVMQLMKTLAAEEKRTIICTIHQPSSELIDLFDDVLLLAKGRVMYHGSFAELPAYLSINTKYTLPEHHNPSDFVMKLLQQDDVDEMLDAWEQHVQKAEVYRDIHIAPPMSLRSESYTPPRRNSDTTLDNSRHAIDSSALTQVTVLFARSWRNSFRNPNATLTRTILSWFFSVLIGLFFLNMGRDQGSVQDRQGLLFLMVVNQSFMAMMNGLIVFPPERAIFLREQANGSYSPFYYVLSKFLAETPMNLFVPAVAHILMYFLSDMQRDASLFFQSWIVLILVTNCAQSFGFMLSTGFARIDVALTIAPLFMLPMVLVTGLMANTKRLEPAWTWLNHISFPRYAYTAMLITEMQHITFSQSTTEYNQFQTGHDVLVYTGFASQKYAIQVMALVVMMFGLRLCAALLLFMHAREVRAKDIFDAVPRFPEILPRAAGKKLSEESIDESLEKKREM